MCGICGFIDFSGSFESHEVINIIDKMNRTLIHRGPDDSGYWKEPDLNLIFGHRRLSIQDLSEHGHQPMISESGRYVIIFNGEIYNYLEIKRKLESSLRQPKWHGHSDTEIMLSAIDEWGLEKAIESFAGMFAFAIWDRKNRVLSLARDRAGEKPLYYTSIDDNFIFSSEIKAMRSHPSWKGTINHQALSDYFRYGYIPAPKTIYEGVYKLEPGTILKLNFNQAYAGISDINIKHYWSLYDQANKAIENPFEGSFQDAKSELEKQLQLVISEQMQADVPFGAFLSSGVDSSLIVALMQLQSSKPINTFTIGFNENDFNEADDAKKIANYLGTEHHELYITHNDAISVIPELSSIWDEPFSDPSQIPTYLVSKLAKRHVSVSLSGDAGDELFGGYNRHISGPNLWNNLNYIPHFIRGYLSKGMQSIPLSIVNDLCRILPKRLQYQETNNQFYKLSKVINSHDFDGFYNSIISKEYYSQNILINGNENVGIYNDIPEFGSLNEKIMYRDMCSYLPNDILVKLDRASMAVSLESRVPFLDHRVIEFALRLPLDMKIKKGVGKCILRNMLNDYVPNNLVNNNKRGFSVPLGDWLRGPLKDWAESLLDKSRIENEGYLNADLVRKLWGDHLSGKTLSHYSLWTILMFQVWLEQEVGN